MAEIGTGRDGGATSRVAVRAALAEARIARLERGLISVAGRLDELSVGSPHDPLLGLGRRVRAMLRSEELLSGIDAGIVGACLGIERFLLSQQLASPRPREIVASFSADALEPALAASMAAALAELIVMSESATAEGAAGRLYVTSGRMDGDVVFAFAAEDDPGAPEAGGAGHRAERRAERLVRLAGGTFVRGVDKGRMVVGMLIPAGTGAADRPEA